MLFSLAYFAISMSWCFVVSTKGTFLIAAAFGAVSGCWLGTYTSTVIELLGSDMAATSQSLLNVLSATAVLCGLSVGAALTGVGQASQSGPGAFTAICFGLAGILFWLSTTSQ